MDIRMSLQSWVSLQSVCRVRLIFAIALFFLATAGPAKAQWDCTGVAPNKVGLVTWTPANCDEFNGAAGSAPSISNWGYDTGNSGFGNSEVEFYCDPRSNVAPCSTSNPNIALDGSGHLQVKAMLNGSQWTSGRLNTGGRKDFQFGRIEASIKLPDTTNQGLWPAFWSLGSNFGSVGWPACGEADFMEVWSPMVFGGPGPLGNRSTIHTVKTDGSGVQPNGAFTFTGGAANDTGFHTYGVIWSANMMQYYVDNPGAPFYIATAGDLASSDTWPFNLKFFLLMNVAVGGTLGGTPGASTPNPGIMTVDYVRQYQPSAIATPVLGNPTSITVKAGATSGNSTTFTPGLAAGTGYVYFSCSTTAPKASCLIATNDPLNARVVNSGTPETVTVSVATTANAIVLPQRFDPKPWLLLRVAMAAILAFAILALAVRRRGRGLRPAYAMAALVMLVGFTIAGCGGGSGGITPPPNNGTPPGSYTVTVYAFTESNASDGTNAHADASVAVPLTVN